MRSARRLAASLATLALLIASASARAADDGAVDGPAGAHGHEAGAETAMIVAPDSDADAGTRAGLVAAWRALGPDYEPRTEHFLPDGSPKYVNRLVREASPYLLQHAHNPVNWFPWGEEAFARAVAEERPIFLSIGYATCHWCHVMERESFENEAIAKLLNRYFVPIKVDREQHPDVDALYMTAVQLLTGGGGWPMSSFLAPDGRPFHGGTYYPPDAFAELLDQVSLVWATDQDAVLEQAERIAEALDRVNTLAERVREVGPGEIGRARRTLLSRVDAERGGFGGAPKFPQESALLFLLERGWRGDAEALAAADLALERMAAGGIHDQIGGGFHRYAVDAAWAVPHFEKMLYNQAGLARAYTLGRQLTGDEDHAATARGILDYVLREMTSDEGLFFSATDADSEGREGAYFVWTEEQLAAALEDARDVELAAALWGVDEIGNFEIHEMRGETVLHRGEPLAEVAERFDTTPEALADERARLARTLREARERREPPLLDDKALSGWNGLMITAFAEAGAAFAEPRYTEAAARAADALWESAWDVERRALLRSRYRGESTIDARQTDYAWLAEAMLALHDAIGEPRAAGSAGGDASTEATSAAGDAGGGDELPGDPASVADGAEDGARWLARARLLSDAMLERFVDPEHGGLFLGAESVRGAALVVRPKDIDDASTPSGNGVALRVLSRLHERTGERRYAEEADRLVDAFAGTVANRGGAGLSSFMGALAERLEGEAGPRRWSERGIARVVARVRENDRVEVTIELADGWHLNSDAPLQDYLVATALGDVDGEPLEAARFPEPVERRLGFQRETLSLFEGEVTLSAALPASDVPAANAREEGAEGRAGGAASPGSARAPTDGGTAHVDGATPRVVPIVLRLQTCSDEVCLAPESLRLDVPLAPL